MAITAAGVGSGLDVQGIVSQLMQLERLPLVKLERQEAATNSQLSAYGQVKSAISSFQSAMKDLSSVDKFKIFTSTSSDEDVLSAETTSSAAAGIYNIQVNRLAQNHKMGSDEKLDTDTLGGNLGSDEKLNTDTFGGTLGDSITLTVGVDSSTLDLSSAQTLTEMRDAINAAGDNPGVTASILSTGPGTERLVLSADQPGVENSVQLSYGGTINASTLNLDAANTGDSITLTVGADSTTLDLSTAQTLSEMRDAINSASDNPGVTATIMNTGTNTQRLVLTANESGYDNRVQLSYGGTISAGSLNFATTNQDELGDPLGSLAELDSSFTLDGFALTSASNKVSGVMDGITFELKKAGTVTLNVQRDTSSIEDSAKAFVDAYNNVLSTLDRQASNTLSGDSTLRSIRGLLRGTLNTAPVGLTGAFNSLSELGIKTNADSGQLELNGSDFTDALDSDFASVADLFANDNQGFAFRFDALAETMLDTDGLIDSREDGLRDRIERFQDGQVSLERRLELKEKSLRSQYASLDSLVGSLQNTASFLFQQLS